MTTAADAGTYRRVRRAVLNRDGHTCSCGNPASTVRYLPGARPAQGVVDDPVRLDPEFMVAVCGPCQVVTPADQSGAYGRQQRRRRRSNRRNRAAA